jgi:membrane protease YdiL (CAAX protease family)
MLCSIAFIYVGFSLKENPVSSIILEVAVALIFYFIAVFGYSRNNSLIAYGIILHGIWDILHHKQSLIKTDIPNYWPLYCLIADFILGGYFLFVFNKKKE